MRALAAAIVCTALAAAAAAQTPVAGYPAKPIRLVAPFPPGGSTDIVVRSSLGALPPHTR